MIREALGVGEKIKLEGADGGFDGFMVLAAPADTVTLYDVGGDAPVGMTYEVTFTRSAELHHEDGFDPIPVFVESDYRLVRKPRELIDAEAVLARNAGNGVWSRIRRVLK